MRIMTELVANEHMGRYCAALLLAGETERRPAPALLSYLCFGADGCVSRVPAAQLGEVPWLFSGAVLSPAR